MQVSDPVRTVADMLAGPQLGGGIRNVADVLAVLLNENVPNVPRLVEDLGRIGNGAAFKRLGIILEARHPEQTALIDACRARLTTGYVKLDPMRSADRLITVWRLWVPASSAGGSR